MKKLHIKLTFTEPLLGTSPANEHIYRDFIGSKAPDAQIVEDEVAALGADAHIKKGHGDDIPAWRYGRRMVNG